MRRSRWALAATGALLLAGCGGGGGGPPVWEGPPRPAADGRLDVASFNDFLAGDGSAWARSPVLVATEFVRLDESDAATTSVVSRVGAEGGGPATVVATLDGLPDDSVRAMRYVLRVERQDDGSWRLRSAVWAQRCWPGRGHQRFSPELCV